MIRKTCFHRGRHSQCLVDSAEIVVGMIDRNHVAVILKLLGEGIRKAREAPDAHSEVEVLPFHVAGGDVLRIGRTAENARADADALGGTVASVGLIGRCAVGKLWPKLFEIKVITHRR